MSEDPRKEIGVQGAPLEAENAPGRHPENDPLRYREPDEGDADSMGELAGHSFDPRSWGYAVVRGRKRRKGGITGYGV